MTLPVIKCPLCSKNTDKNDKIRLYPSEKEDVFCCPVCKSSSMNDDYCVYYCLKCGHILCNECIDNMSIHMENVNNMRFSHIHIDSETHHRLLKISKLIVRVLRYYDHQFIVNNNGVISAPIVELFNNLNVNIVTPAIEINDIHLISEYFKYRSGRKRFGINIIHGIEYIDTDARYHEY